MKVLAHRGASGYAPENTIAAFNKAIQMGADGIELDVQLTMDNQLVIHHDFMLGRTSTGTGFIKDLELDYILSQDAGSWFDESFKGEKIPTLRQFFEIVPKGTIVNIELKALAIDERDIASYVEELLIELGRVDDCIISSFNHKTLKTITKTRKGMLVYSRFLQLNDYLIEDDFYSIHPAVENTDEAFIKQMHDIHKKVYIYTVNDKEVALYLKSLNVDAIITNYPDILTK